MAVAIAGGFKNHARSSVARRDQSRTARVRRANAKSVFATMRPTRRSMRRAIACATNCCRCCSVIISPPWRKQFCGSWKSSARKRIWSVKPRGNGSVAADVESAQTKSQSRLTSAATIEKENFASLPVAVQRRVLQLQLTELGVAPDFELIEQLRESPGKFVSVSSSVSIARDAGGKLDCKKHVASGFNANETVRQSGGQGRGHGV